MATGGGSSSGRVAIFVMADGRVCPPPLGWGLVRTNMGVTSHLSLSGGCLGDIPPSERLRRMGLALADGDGSAGREQPGDEGQFLTSVKHFD